MTHQLGGVLHDWSTEAPRRSLPQQGRYLLLSDLHLGDGQQTDLFRGQDDAFIALLDAQHDLDGIILNGDILDAAQSPEWWHRYYRGLLRYDTARVRQDVSLYFER